MHDTSKKRFRNPSPSQVEFSSTEDKEMGNINLPANEDSDNTLTPDESHPAHPYNWQPWKVNLNAGLLAFLSFLTPLASCEFRFPSKTVTLTREAICAPAVPSIMSEFGNDSPELAAIVVSIYVLGVRQDPRRSKSMLTQLVCFWPPPLRPLVRNLRPTPSIPRVQHRLRLLPHRLCPRSVPQLSHRLSLSIRHIWLLSHHQRRRLHS